ncbi:MAG: plastocyanin/azurin family copper-binding protein [Candidatus Nitrosocaldus sp.]|nr:plastocyanin/azurin family copper-binding protein [Candidatus Nitrosocaldus sp.]
MNMNRGRMVILALLGLGLVTVIPASVYLISPSYMHPTESLNDGGESISYKEPLPSTNTPVPALPSNPNLDVFAVSERANTALSIAVQDDGIREMIEGWLDSGAHVTVAGVQPIALSDDVRISEPKQHPVHHELLGRALEPVLRPVLDNIREGVSSSNIYNSSRYGEVIIAVNWHAMDGHPYPVSDAVDLERGGVYEAHQQIRRVIVDIDERRIRDVIVEPERVMRHDLRPGIIYMESNVFMPYSVVVRPNTVLSWHNYSSFHHNVVGVYRAVDGSTMSIDSKDIDEGGVWQYLFSREGVFEYHCTYHADEGMRGIIVVSGSMG